MSKLQVPEQVYRDTARAKLAAARHPLADDEATVEAVATDRVHRVGIEIAYRAGYGQGRDDEADGTRTRFVPAPEDGTPSSQLLVDEPRNLWLHRRHDSLGP